MIEVKGTNITCGLGLDTDTVYDKILRGESGIMLHDKAQIGVTEDFMASTVDASLLPATDMYGIATHLEKMAIHSIMLASKECPDIDLKSPRTLFILSSTKGNVELLDHPIEGIDNQRVCIPEMARYIASRFNTRQQPIVVSNACISGLSAIILAGRLLKAGIYDNIVVTGVDGVTKFTVSGFQSFKALSAKRCRPFDSSRDGLNLGEAAATIILSRTDTVTPGHWYYESGAMHNDANHISGPSRVGEGSFRCLMSVIKDMDVNNLAMINTHGTATPYNDEMESIAIERAGLASIPVNAYKGYLGHTLGAAGILECIISMKSLDNNTVIKTLGFENIGVSRHINIVTDNTTSTRHEFIKMMSGFGGSNAALRFRKEVTR